MNKSIDHCWICRCDFDRFRAYSWNLPACGRCEVELGELPF